MPTLIYETPEEEALKAEAERRKAATAEWTKMLEEIDNTPQLSAATLSAIPVISFEHR